MSEHGDVTRTVTGQYRFRLRRRWFRDPLVVLQLEIRKDEQRGYHYERWETISVYWRDVTVEDLTTMSLTNLISPREGDEMPICFKPIRRMFGWSLALQVCDGDYKTGDWRPARLQDLMIKNGKIQGGLGLVRR